ncbi:restriction endonuclease [Thalassobaculum sp.]|uniref:Eco57I restriction-modification methylase domain-containing protein n=1 Tax=Thalassobaculum sp. TaxID=2022740 RepID=UPI0032ECB9ED
MFKGSLLTREFLLEGIAETDAWRAFSEVDLESCRKALRSIASNFLKNANPNEAETEKDFIYPTLEAIGWTDFSVQTNLERKGRKAPDALLFLSSDAKAKAISEKDRWKGFRFGACLVEAKKWERPLDREEKGLGTPSSQIINYLSRADVQTDGSLLWGILTNGRYWRLYYQKAQSRAEDFLEIDLAKALRLEGFEADLVDRTVDERLTSDHLLKLFVVIFGRNAFAPVDSARHDFHALAMEEGRKWEERVAEDLSAVIFQNVFPRLVAAIPEGDPDRPAVLTPDYLEAVREGALILLYRLLFVLFAEDRNLLPDEEGPYKDYSLTKIRLEISDAATSKKTFSDRAHVIWARLKGVFSAINEGDNSLGIPAYNGGLFHAATAPILGRCELSDAVLADVVFGLSHETSSGTPRYINYRDLTVQQLGSIYERILEYAVVVDGGNVSIRLDTFARKGSGSYYTPDDLVRLIIRETVGPLVEERLTAFAERSVGLASDERPVTDRLIELAVVDPANAMLDLKVCDPAMGSGHFLVSLVDWLADQILQAMANAEEVVDWSLEPYRSPLAERIADIRHRIIDAARTNHWPIVEEQLEDRHIVRRMILKRVVYGVDKNPMAVELAKVALWLHTFTVGAPLSFLDHHLRSGDSLFGERVSPVMDWISGIGSLLINPLVARAKSAVSAMETIEHLTDADIAEVKVSTDRFHELEALISPLRAVMDLFHALKWIGDLDPAEQEALNRLLKGDFGDIDELMDGRRSPPVLSADREALIRRMKAKDKSLSKADRARARGALVDEALGRLLERVRDAVHAHGFLHWQVAFPGVWSNWELADPEGGFDAVIGNPPWDRLKFQEVEWFAARRREIALATRASDRKRMVAELKASGDDLALQHEKAQQAAEAASRVARTCGEYPLLSGGDTNIYSLFVERALSVVSKIGLVGLLIPSGIASDKTASEFFSEILKSNKLRRFYDFFNKRLDGKLFFPDVYYRFKFSVVVIGSSNLEVGKPKFCFFTRDISELGDESRCFSMDWSSISRINPNTGTAPIFRSKHDASLTGSIYDRLPVLAKHSDKSVSTVYPTKYMRMFDMTNDANLFVTELELKEHGYPAGGHLYRSGSDAYVPLYEGKMVQMYDHRAASVILNTKNVSRQAVPVVTTPREHADPNHLSVPQYWVNRINIPDHTAKWVLCFKDVTSTTNSRSMIACLSPYFGFGNNLPIIIQSTQLDGGVYLDWAPLLCANFNSIALDFVARQKIQGNHLNWYIVEQLPIVPPDTYDRAIGPKTVREIVRGEVLALSYTANDMVHFAEDMGHVDPTSGEVLPPFTWDERDRLRRRAKLDALYFMLYFLSSTEADYKELRDIIQYVYSTFPISERYELAEHGRYLSRDLCLAYLNALKAGDPDADISLT